MSKSILIVLLTAVFAISCGTNPDKKDQTDQVDQVPNAGQGPKVEFIDKTDEQRIDVMVDGALFTSYIWPDQVFKPILYPVYTSAGTEITRGFPLNPKTGERADHSHHTGMWLTYGDVNGFDFWGNGSKGLGKQNDNGGVIKHIRVDQTSGGVGEGSLSAVESWTDHSGNEILGETTEYHFMASGSTRIIDRITTLTAGDTEVVFPDTKEGMFAIRVARQLELPSEGSITLYSADGHPEKVENMSNEGISGNYRSSEGVTGLEVWGTRARWMDLFGNIGDEKISLVICDHPNNPGYPTYWHARGYGLFSANPFGWNDFTKGKEQMNFSIPDGQSITFRYRVIISSGVHLNDAEINAYTDEFAREYE